MKRSINGTDFLNMMLFGAQSLQNEVDSINALNVFPVPDGDTGTNMNLTMKSGIQEMQARSSGNLGTAAEALSKGLLMGARGNSGVILSQLFRGFAKAVNNLEEVNAEQFAVALQQGVDTAYQAVVKPVEGTILTVSKEAGKHALIVAPRNEDILLLLLEVTSAAKKALAHTPELLPILKQVGVVDAGGQGLVFIYEGFVRALQGEILESDPLVQAPSNSASSNLHRMSSVQSQLATEDIEFGYCTEFIVQLHETGKIEFNETKFRSDLGQLGDSLLVVADEDLVKVHIHAELPGTVMNQAMKFGDLTRIKIENMREQHSHILMEDERIESQQQTNLVKETKPYGFVTIALGQGISDIFLSLGVDEVISGGQTMNPSTEDIVQAINQIPADTVFVLPNNSNIIMAAKQAQELSDKQVVVIPTKNISQGLAAVVAFREEADTQLNTNKMTEAIAHVKSGSVTYAVRDSQIGGLTIQEGDFLGMLNQDIVTTGKSLVDVSEGLLRQMIERGDEVVTIFSGEDATDSVNEQLSNFLEVHYPQVEIDQHAGGQPLYYYLISVE
jgi:DAK2 domain fusion protein YloV